MISRPNDLGGLWIRSDLRKRQRANKHDLIGCRQALLSRLTPGPFLLVSTASGRQYNSDLHPTELPTTRDRLLSKHELLGKQMLSDELRLMKPLISSRVFMTGESFGSPRVTLRNEFASVRRLWRWLSVSSNRAWSDSPGQVHIHRSPCLVLDRTHPRILHCRTSVGHYVASLSSQWSDPTVTTISTPACIIWCDHYHHHQVTPG